MTNKDQQTVLDVVAALNREFRYNPSFMVMVHQLDDDAARRVGKFYMEWLFKVLEMERESAVPH
jgi:hypothetical protein